MSSSKVGVMDNTGLSNTDASMATTSGVNGGVSMTTTSGVNGGVHSSMDRRASILSTFSLSSRLGWNQIVLCGASPVSAQGRQRQMCAVLCVTLIPVVILLALCSINLSNQVRHIHCCQIYLNI